MHYSNKPKIVFLAISKTGTRSVVAYLEKYFKARKYSGTETHEIVIPKPLKGHYAFAVVRNPFDRMISYWWSTCQRPNSSRLGLEEFLKMDVDRSQHRYLKPNRIDKILRYENLEEEFKQLPFYVANTSLEWLNPTVKVAAHNPNPRPSTAELLTLKARDIIVKMFKRDFEVLGYPTEYKE